MNVVENEVARISREHLQLDNLLEEILGNIKLPVDYKPLLTPEIERKISFKHYPFANISIFDYGKLNLQYYNISKQIKLLDK